MRMWDGDGATDRTRSQRSGKRYRTRERGRMELDHGKMVVCSLLERHNIVDLLHNFAKAESWIEVTADLIGRQGFDFGLLQV